MTKILIGNGKLTTAKIEDPDSIQENVSPDQRTKTKKFAIMYFFSKLTAHGIDRLVLNVTPYVDVTLI